MQIKKVGVVGAGTMGSGIAQNCARSGYQTIICEVNQELLDKGFRAIKDSLTRGVEKGKLMQSAMDATLTLLRGSINIQDFKDCDLFIEAVPEDMQIKKKVFADLDEICLPHTIIASNTSCLSIIDMAMVTKRPNKVLGMHFFIPAHAVRFLELVKTIVTSDEALSIAKVFGESLGKTVIIVKDAPGFIVNRSLVPYILENIRLLESGYATKEDIDEAIKLGMKFPVGPFEACDMVGLDTMYFVASAMYEELKDPKFAPPILLKKMVVAGQLGCKTGKGFYEYR